MDNVSTSARRIQNYRKLKSHHTSGRRFWNYYQL